jgi:hypothetical protein
VEDKICEARKKMDALLEWPLGAIFALSIAVLWAASEFGHAIGLRSSGEANVSTLEASVLGLLALMLSFTFAMALNRFEERREGVLVEANAIGTATLRAGLLPVPYAAESVKLFREYVQVRLDIAKRVPAQAEVSAAIARSNGIQSALWRKAKEAIAVDNSMVPTGLYIQSLNEVIDNQEKRLTAFQAHVPTIVLLALYGISIVAIGFAGYAGGLEKRPWRLPVYVMASLVAAVILLIQDVDRPTTGFIAVNQQPIIAANVIAEYSLELERGASRKLR